MGIPIRVLIVDDSPDDAALLVHALKCGGYDVTSARVDTPDAMGTRLREKWDLVISDYSMPRFTGLAALSILKDCKKDIPFILVSGTVGEDIAVSAMRAGANDYIMKDKLLRLVPAVQRELREAANRIALREKEEQFRQAQKMELIGQLAGGVAHDFNNVLAVSLMYCDMLLEKLPAGDPMRGDVEQIRKSGERAAAITRQLLATSRKQVLEPRILDLNLVISSMEKMLRTLIGEHIELKAELQPALGRVRVDPAQMEQVIMNLVINARDAMPKGGNVVVRTENVERGEAAASAPNTGPGPYVMVTVTDTGCGMDAGTKARIFEPFFTTKGPNRGTGLGLSTVFGIVSQSHGHIAVESQPGKGTSIKIYLPRLDLPPEPLAVASVPRAGAGRASGTILLVEDSDELRTALSKCLEHRGYEVLKPLSSGEALAVIEQAGKTVDLLVTDVVMPQLSGPELARRLLAAQPRMRVLFISGYLDDTLEAFEDVRDRASFLQKPFSSDALLRKIQDVMSAEG